VPTSEVGSWPQHCTLPAAERTQTVHAPTASSTASVTPFTSTGSLLQSPLLGLSHVPCARSPSPSWPPLFSPQQRTLPVAKSAQPERPAICTSMAPARPGMGWGGNTLFCVGRSPQQDTPPFARRTQKW
jgi:hypothetical protein